MDQEITIDGQKIHYQRSGQGPALIVMHGWGCRAATMQLFEDAAAPTHTVYNLDMPGFGESDEPTEVWGVDDYARMLERFVTELGIERPKLVGHSFGGRVAIVYASRNDVDKLILVDSAGVKPRRSLWFHTKVRTFKTGKWMAQHLLPKSVSGNAIERLRKAFGSSDYGNASAKMRAIMSRVVNEDLTGLMPKIEAPTLLLWGENDTATPMRDARIMEKLIPDAGLVSFPGAGHYSYLDQPQRSRLIFQNFINS